jgi:hypothetical protein
MNSRIPYSINRDNFVFLVDGSVFKHTGDGESRRQASIALEEHANRVLAALDARAGRRLTHRELLSGVKHVETRPVDQRIDVGTRQAQPDVNPYEIVQDLIAKPESPKKRMQRLAEEFDNKRLTAAERLAFNNDPERLRAVAHAEAELKSAKLDPNLTQEDIENAQARVAIARTGTAEQYAAADNAWRLQVADRASEAIKPYDERISLLQQRKKAILEGSYRAPPPPVVVEATPEPEVPTVQTSLSDSDARLAATRELDRVRKVIRAG